MPENTENETKTTAKAKKANNKIINIAGIFIIIAGIAIGVILALQHQTINDAFFIPNDNKYVLTRSSENGGDFGENKAHTVAMVKDDEIKSLAVYYEFESSDKAKENFETIDTVYKEGSSDSIKNISIKDKYIIVEYADKEFANMTASDFKAQVEFYQEVENSDYDYWTEDEITDGSTEKTEPETPEATEE